MTEALSAIIFLAAMSYAMLIIGRKIPLLLQMPQQLIEESFVTRPSRLRKYFSPVAIFFREERYRDLYYAALIWSLHRLRVWLLRLERLTFRALEAVQMRNRRLSETEEKYWSELKQWKQGAKRGGSSIPREVLHADAPDVINLRRPPKDNAPEDS